MNDEEHRLHKRINDLSVAVMAVSAGLILLACGAICMNLGDLMRELDRIF